MTNYFIHLLLFIVVLVSGEWDEVRSIIIEVFSARKELRGK